MWVTYGLSCVAASLLFFRVTPRRTFGERFEWSVRSTETLHALIVVVGSLRWIARGQQNEALVEITAGYLVFDTAYEIALPWARGTRRWPDAAFMTHHVVGIVAHAWTLRYQHAGIMSYAPYIYLADVTNPFLHWSWMLNALGRAKGTLYLVNGAIGALLYVVVRVILPLGLLIHILVAGPHVWAAQPGHPRAYWLFLASHVCFLALNVFWFTKLLKLVTDKVGTKQGENAKKEA